MKQQIINILEKYTNQIDIQGYGELNLVNEDEFYKIAEEIEKLYKNKSVDRETIYIKESPQDDYEFSIMRRSEDKSYGDRYDEKVIRHFSDD